VLLCLEGADDLLAQPRLGADHAQRRRGGGVNVAAQGSSTSRGAMPRPSRAISARVAL
jgi:hypothetical protein